MTIRRAKTKDHEILTDLMRKSKAVWGYNKEQLEKWKEDLTISKEYINRIETFKLIFQKEIIGFYSQKKQEAYLKLDNLFIAPEHIGKGFGGMLLKHFVDRSKSTQYSEKLILEADPNAEQFYQKHHFKTIGLQKTSVSNRFMPIMVWSESELKNVKLFESTRLFVRHLFKEDIEEFYKMQSNSNVMKYIKPTMNYEESKIELNRFINYYGRRNRMFSIWAVVEKQTEKFVGICGVYLNKKGETEIAYRLQESSWGKGLGKEVAEKLINFCFGTLDYKKLYAYVMKGNIGSLKILNKIMSLEREIGSKEESTKSYVYNIKKENWQYQYV